MITLRNTYALAAGDRFDEDYFVSRHVPLAHDVLSPATTGHRVLKPIMQSDASAGASVIVEFDFPDRETMGRALASPRMAELAEDVPNYSDVRGTVTILEESSPS